MKLDDERERAFERLEHLRRKADDLAYEAELAAYREAGLAL